MLESGKDIAALVGGSGGAEDYGYSAFISYRHVEPDRKWAKWLHSALETYRVPKWLVEEQGVAPPLKPVFRDEEELPASSDLNDEIEVALRQSRFLIVVCSRQTPESRWVNKEIVRFRELGRSKRILALLIDGEPSEAFPPALREIRRAVTDEQGHTAEEVEEVEPLAADVRSLPSRRENKRYLRRMARLRLLACILGCRFDELRRREQERRIRRLVYFSGLMTALIIVMIALSVVTVIQKIEADSQRQVAVDAKNEETVQRDKAERALERESAERKLKEEQLQRSERLLYASQIATTQRAWTNGDLIAAWQYLDACRWDFRGWEHDYLHTLMTSGYSTLVGHGDTVRSVAFSPD
ncbi:MAG: toll/interleukin-1 receptor domain-containing protein, partial [Planctomycetes bacterium]|nr:toll/interleukin-1 receptor domain-containing protein [Planctomycetota bacterium]